MCSVLSTRSVSEGFWSLLHSKYDASGPVLAGLDSEIGGLGSRPNAAMLADVRFWSDRHVLSAWPAGGLEEWAVGLVGNGGAPSHETETGDDADTGELGNINGKGSFILRTDRKGEMTEGPRSPGRRGRENECS